MNLWLSLDKLHAFPVVQPLIMVLVSDISDCWRYFLAYFTLEPRISDEEKSCEEKVWKQVNMRVTQSDNVKTHFVDILNLWKTFKCVCDQMSAWLINNLDVKVRNSRKSVSIRTSKDFSSSSSKCEFSHHTVDPFEGNAVILETVVLPGYRFLGSIVQRSYSESTEFPRSRESRSACSDRAVFSGVLIYKGIGIPKLLMMAFLDVVKDLHESVFHNN
jgi:hypothetical protein